MVISSTELVELDRIGKLQNNNNIQRIYIKV